MTQMQTVKLGGTVLDILTAINENFSELNTGKAETGEIPTRLSQLANDAKYQTEAQVLAAVEKLVGAAPEALDTLRELADALGNDPDFAATITQALSQKVDKAEGKGLSSNDYTDAEKAKLAGLKNYVLPAAGEKLGGVKNGGSVFINPDGTMRLEAAKELFTVGDSRWSGLANGVYTLTISTGGRVPLGVYRQNSGGYSLTMADIQVSGDSVKVLSYDKFAGYLWML